MKDHYLALAEHVPQVDNVGSYDMAVTPALIVHGILAFTALAFIAAVFLGDGSQRLSHHEIARNTVANDG
jgi:hypothetical protein